MGLKEYEVTAHFTVLCESGEEAVQFMLDTIECAIGDYQEHIVSSHIEPEAKEIEQ